MESNRSLSQVLSRLEKVSGSAPRWMACCPAHKDHTPSLSITQADDGTTLMHCHAGCAVSDIVAAIGMKEADLFSKPQSTTDKVVINYDYVDEEGELLYQVVRKPDKTFLHRRPDGKDGWEWSASGVRKVLYRLPQVLEAIENGETVIVTEGEKDVHTFEHYGYVATCCSGGAQGWKKEFGDIFKGANVVLCGDQDVAGQSYLRQVRESLTSAASISKVELPALYKDVTDWHEDRGSKEDIVFMVKTASAFSREVLEETNTTFSATSIQFSDPESSNHESRLYSNSDVMNVVPMWGYDDPPPMKWIVDGAVPENYITILGADGGTGKSFLALELMYCVATGTPFLGSEVEKSRVLYVDYELEETDQKRRWSRVLAARGQSQYSTALEGVVFFIKPMDSLSNKEVINRLVETVARLDIGLVVIDSLTIGLGADATSQEVVTRVMKSLEKLPTVLAIDHVTHAVRNSNLSSASVYGSVMKRNGSRSLLMLGRAEGGGLLLRQNKTNFGKERDLVCFELVFEEDEGPVRFELRELTDEVMLGALSSLKAHEISRVALEELYGERQIPVSPEEIARWRDEQGVPVGERTVRNHLTQLKRSGLAINISSNSWIPSSDSSSRSLPLGTVTSDDTGRPVFTEGQVLLTPKGLGKVEEVEPSRQGRLPVRLDKDKQVKYFPPSDLELPF